MILISSVLLIGCENDEVKIQKKLFEMRSYKCTAVIKINSNKNTIRYKVRQEYVHPSKYRMEIIEPQFLAGVETKSDGSETTISNPGIKGDNLYITENIKAISENSVFLTSFINSYLFSEKATMRKNGEKYILKTESGSKNQYIHFQILTLNQKGIPETLEMNDLEGRQRMLVTYDEFTYNVREDERKF